MLIKVKVFADNKEEKILKIKADKFEIKTKARATRGEANQRVLEIFYEIFPQNKGIKIVKGFTTSNKIIEVLEPDSTLL